MMNNYCKLLSNKINEFHRIDESDDLNFYFQKYLKKLRLILLRIALLILFVVHFCPLFLCRLFIYKSIDDLRTSFAFLCSTLALIFCLFARLHIRMIRFGFVLLVFTPMFLTYSTDQWHLFNSIISILLIYTFFIFDYLCSFLIASVISIVFFLVEPTKISLEFFSMMFSHFLLHLFGLYFYRTIIQRIRRNFNEYEKTLEKKNRAHVDWKKLQTIIGFCQDDSPRIPSTISMSRSPSDLHPKFGVMIYCVLSLNKQCHLHTSDEFASFIDILFCQIEGMIRKNSMKNRYVFDNETIGIFLPDGHDDFEHRCQLSIDLARFIDQVNRITQWSLTFVIGIDWNSIDLISNEYFYGSAFDYSRWLTDRCSMTNHLHVSDNFRQHFKENSSFHFQHYLSINGYTTYLMFHDDLTKPFEELQMNFHTSDMIDQLTRIQTEFYVDQHLGTMTLTRPLRKRSLTENSKKFLQFFTLNFREKSLQNEFNSFLSREKTSLFIYIFIVMILIESMMQRWPIDHHRTHFSFLFPSIVLTILLIGKYFDRYFNVFRCFLVSTLIFAENYFHSIRIYQQVFLTKNVVNKEFSQRFHHFITFASIFSFYSASIFRRSSWIFKMSFILLFSTIEIYSFEYFYLETNAIRSTVSSLHHYTILTLFIVHQLILIIVNYLVEFIDKSNFLWLKQLDDERKVVVQQRDEVQEEILSIFPSRLLNYYLNSDSNLTSIQHYHCRYEQMALLFIEFHSDTNHDDFHLIKLFDQIDSLLKQNELYKEIVMHKKISLKEILFSIDIEEKRISILSLVELLFQIEEILSKNFQSKILLSACLHIGRVDEVLIHLEKTPKCDLWAEDVAFVRSLLKHCPTHHCLATKSVYEILNDFYLFRTAGSIQSFDHQSKIFYLLGRLIGENIFQGRQALPLSISHSAISSTTDDSQQERHLNQSSLTRSSSFLVPTDQQSLIKTSKKNSDRLSYRQTLLQALNSTLIQSVSNNDESPMKRLSKFIFANSPFDPKKCLVLTQTMLSGTIERNDRCRTNSPYPTSVWSPEQKSFTCDHFHTEQSISSRRNDDETTSSFSACDEPINVDREQAIPLARRYRTRPSNHSTDDDESETIHQHFRYQLPNRFQRIYRGATSSSAACSESGVSNVDSDYDNMLTSARNNRRHRY